MSIITTRPDTRRIVQCGTLAEFTARYGAPPTPADPGLPMGSLFFTTDVGARNVFAVLPVAGVMTWVQIDSAADLGAVTLTGTQTITGTKAFQTAFTTLGPNDAVNNAVSKAATFVHTTTGTPAVGIGVSTPYAVENDGGTQVNAATPSAELLDATAGSEDSQYTLSLLRAGSEENTFRLALPAAGETAAFLLVNRAGVFTLDRIALGAADSGGVGFKALVVPN